MGILLWRDSGTNDPAALDSFLIYQFSTNMVVTLNSPFSHAPLIFVIDILFKAAMFCASSYNFSP